LLEEIIKSEAYIKSWEPLCWYSKPSANTADGQGSSAEPHLGASKD
jgi:hypothetical protein